MRGKGCIDIQKQSRWNIGRADDSGKKNRAKWQSVDCGGGWGVG